MAQRIVRQGWWRLATAVLLVIIVIPPHMPRAQAQGPLVVAVTDQAGAPLAGAEVAIYEEIPAAEDAGEPAEGDPAIVLGDQPVAGPLATDESGLAIFDFLPDDVRLFAMQTSAPYGYVPAPDAVPLDIEASSVENPGSITFVATQATGLVEAIVAGAESGAPLEGTTVTAYTLPDPESGMRGDLVGDVVTGPEGIARFDLTVGTYIIAITAPTPGFIAPGSVADQPISVSMPVDGQRDYQTVIFELRTTPPEPENTPTMEVPVATEPPPPAAPTEIVAPTMTAVPPPASDEALIFVTGVFCTSTLQFNSVAYYQVGVDSVAESFADNQVPDCRLATENELTFTVIDPRTEEVFDDEVIAMAPSSTDGTTVLSIPVVDGGQFLLLGEEESLTPSAPFSLAPGEARSIVAVNYILPAASNLTVRTLDAETDAIAAGGCFQLLLSSEDDQPYVSCDTDDGATDGRTRFINIPNATYTLQQTSAAYGFAPAPEQTVEIAGRSLDMAVSADALGAIDVRSQVCADTEEPMVLSVAEPVRRGDAGDGTGVGLGVATPIAAGCTPVSAEVVITPADGEPLTIATGDDGRAVPVPVAPTRDETSSHRVAIAGTDISAPVDVQPGAMTIVTITFESSE